MKRQAEPEYMDDAAEADAYANTDFSDVNARFTARFLELAGNAPEAVTLDLGCGPGDITLRVAQARADWHVAGLDASAAMLAFARSDERERLGAPRIWWVLGDAKGSPFPAHSFDVVCSNSILHHIPEPEPFWQDLKRIARPGAFVFLRDLFRPDSPENARAIVERYAGDASTLLQEEYYRSLLSAFVPEEVRGQLAQAGLGMLEVVTVTDRHMDIFGRIG